MTELPHIRYLSVAHEVYRHHRIGAAADAVHLSQPAATQALARIEDILGVALFERQPKGMVPTDAGLLFQKRLTRILEHLRRGDSLARKKAARVSARRAGKSFYRFCKQR